MVMIVIVILLWFCLFTAAPIGKPFEGITFGGFFAVLIFCFMNSLISFCNFSDLPPFLSILSGYSIMAFQFDIHPMLLTLQIDMRKKDKVGWAAFCGIASK